MGDIHGNHKALRQCLERSGFDKENDTLIQLGDVADGWRFVYDCVEELLTIKNLITIKGNHDDWFLEYINTGQHPGDWTQGGNGTLDSYTKKLGFGYGPKYTNGGDELKTGMHPSDLPQHHKDFFINQLPYYKDSNNNLFIHGGFNRHYPLIEHRPYIFWWDRDLFLSALSAHSGNTKLKFKEEFNNIFVGHTETRHWDKTCKPMFVDKVINVDQGAGWNGKLTIMDVDTKEYWQSDLTLELYPDEGIRR